MIYVKCAPFPRENFYQNSMQIAILHLKNNNCLKKKLCILTLKNKNKKKKFLLEAFNYRISKNSVFYMCVLFIYHFVNVSCI